MKAAITTALIAVLVALSTTVGVAAPTYSFTFSGDVSLSVKETVNEGAGCKIHITDTGPTALWETKWTNVVLQPRGPKRVFSTKSIQFAGTHTAKVVIDPCNGTAGRELPACTGHATPTVGSPATITVTPNPRDPTIFEIFIHALGGITEANTHCGTGFYAAALTTEFNLVAEPSLGQSETIPVSSESAGSRAYQPLSTYTSNGATYEILQQWTGTITIVRTR